MVTIKDPESGEQVEGYTLEEVATLLDVPSQKIFNYTQYGNLKYTMIGKRLRFITRGDLKQFLDAVGTVT